MKIYTIYLLCLLQLTIIAKLSEEKQGRIGTERETFVKLQFPKLQKGVFEAGNVIIGANKDTRDTEKGEPTKLLFKTYGSESYIGSKAESKFGINCDEKKFQCITKGDPAACEEEEYKTFTCQKATALLRFKEEALRPEKVYSKFDFNLVQSEDWPNKLGVLSFGPKSTFWKYAASVFKKSEGNDYIETSFYYHSTGYNPYAINLKSFTKTKFIFNGRFGSTEPACQDFTARHEVPTFSGFVWEGSLFSYGTGTKKDVKVCILNDEDVFFYAKKAQHILDTINSDLCGANIGETCLPTDKDYNKQNVKPINFSFKNLKEEDELVKLSYDPSDFIFESEDKKESEILIKSITDFVHPGGQTFESICGNADMAVGRAFLLKAEFIVRAYDDKLLIGFNETTSKDNFMPLIILGGIAILFLLIIVVIGCCNSCSSQESQIKESNEAYERAAEEMEY